MTLLLALLGHLDKGLQRLLELPKYFLRIHHDVSTNGGVHLVDGRCQFWVVVVVHRLANRFLDVAVGAVQVPQRHVLLQVLNQVVEVVRVSKWRLAQERVHCKLQVVLNVGNVILLQVCVGGLANQQSGVFVGRSALLWRWCVLQQFVDVGHLHLLEQTLFHGLGVVQLRVLVRTRDDRLDLGHALRLTEDVRVRHWHNVGVLGEVFTGDFQVGNHVALLHLVKVPTVQAAQNLQHTGLRVMHACMDRREHRSALLNQGLCGAHRGVGVDVSNLLFAGGDHALGGCVQPTQQLKQHL